MTNEELLSTYETLDGAIPPTLRDWCLDLMNRTFHNDPAVDLRNCMREVIGDA